MKPTNFNTPFGATYSPVENKNTADVIFKTTMKQQTPVEWLKEQYIDRGETIPSGVFQEALEKEKEQLIDAYLVGADYATWADATAAKEYYNTKYQNK